jgi:pimeloyl-ACP methyl ester carboxylesterase
MTTFALVHGAWHGAWCWEKVAPLLQEAGHDVVAMDLPIDDNTATFDTHADVVCAAVDGCSDDLILVAHSYGGMVIPLVAARRPVRHLVFVCAFVPYVGRSLDDQLREEPGTFNPAVSECLRFDAESRFLWVDDDLARAFMYADCDKSTSSAAIKRLRPHSPFPGSVQCSLTEFPDVPCTSVICSEDLCIGAERARRIARDRIGAEIIELPGSHAPFLSRPQALADVLLRIADRNRTNHSVQRR